MKKILIIICLLLLISGCGKKEDDTLDNKEPFVLEKVDKDKDYVYSNVISNYVLSDDVNYEAKDIVINLNSEDASNVNMELRSFIRKCNKDIEVSNNKLIKGTIYNYNYYKNDGYLSVVVSYNYYINGNYGDEESLVYVLSLSDGKIKSNNNLLEDFKLSEEELFDKVETSIPSEDSLYTIKNMKENGYYLYVKDNKLVVLFYELTDDESIKKELILS